MHASKSISCRNDHAISIQVSSAHGAAFPFYRAESVAIRFLLALNIYGVHAVSWETKLSIFAGNLSQLCQLYIYAIKLIREIIYWHFNGRPNLRQRKNPSDVKSFIGSTQQSGTCHIFNSSNFFSRTANSRWKIQERNAMLNFNQTLNRNCLANAHQSVDAGQTRIDFLCLPLFFEGKFNYNLFESLCFNSLSYIRWNVPVETKRRKPKM